MPHVPEQASARADAFAHMLARDGYGPTAAIGMIGAIVEHAHAVRLRCDALAELARLERIGSDVPLMSDRIVHGLAKRATTMTRRDLPRLQLRPWGADGKGAKYGQEFADSDMRGRHGNHARGSASHRWNDGKRTSSHGYTVVRVPKEHPHSWGGRLTVGFAYAYEHIVVVMEKLGRPLSDGECVHHIDGNKQNNAPENLEVLTISAHATHHYDERGVDERGRFPKKRT